MSLLGSPLNAEPFLNSRSHASNRQAVDLVYSSRTARRRQRVERPGCAAPSGRRSRGSWDALTVDLARLDGIDDGLRGLAVDLASDAVCRTQDLLDSARQVLREGLVAHGSRNLDDLVEGDGLAVLDVLLLLAVAGGLLEGADDEGGGGGDDGDGGLTVLDGELHRDAETLL